MHFIISARLLTVLPFFYTQNLLSFFHLIQEIKKIAADIAQNVFYYICLSSFKITRNYMALLVQPELFNSKILHGLVNYLKKFSLLSRNFTSLSTLKFSLTAL